MTFLVISSVIAAANSVIAQSLPFVYEDEHGNVMPYRLFLPPDHDPTKEYPIVLALHGAGENGTDNVSQLGFAQNLITATRQPEYASFLIAPQAPIADTWLSIRSVELLEHIVNEVQQHYLVDDEQLYVTGYSMGGFGAIGLLYYLPGKFAAGVPIASGTALADADPVAEVIYDTPIWVFHGAQDTVVPVDYSRLLIDALQDHGASPLYTEYPSSGHGIVHTVYAEQELYPWLFSQRLEAILLSDFDEDGDVDSADFYAWQAGFGTAEGASHRDGDADGDGDVDGGDFLIWQKDHGVTTGSVSLPLAVPEPTSIMLLLAFTALVLTRCRVKRR